MKILNNLFLKIKLKYSPVFFLLMATCNYIMGQQTVYFDENNNQIDSITFKKKCKSHVFSCYEMVEDSILFKMVKPKYYFGELNSSEKHQFLSLLKSRTQLSIDSTKTIIISHKKKLSGFNKTKISYINYWKTRRKYKTYIPLTIKRYNSWQETFDLDQKKCIEGLKSEAIETLFIVDEKDGYTYKSKNFQWIETSIKIHSIFKFPAHKFYTSSVIFIRPNGEYFISRAALPVDFIKNLLSYDTWQKPKEDLENSIKYNAPIGMGIFKDILGYYKNNPDKIETIRDSSGHLIDVPKPRIKKYVEGEYKYPTTCFL